MVAGGGVLAWMDFSMLSGQASSSPASPEAPSNPGASLTPLILFAASLRTIARTRLGFPVTALVAVAVANVLTWLAMLLVARVAHQKVGGGFARDWITRFMGLIALSMGVQFALAELRQFGSCYLDTNRAARWEGPNRWAAS